MALSQKMNQPTEFLLVAAYATLQDASVADTAGVTRARERLRDLYLTTGRPAEAARFSEGQ